MKRFLAKLSRGRVGNGNARHSGASLQPPGLPPLVEEAIATASLIEREADDDGPRVVVMSAFLGGAFIYSATGAEKRMQQAFPQLDRTRVSLAVRMLEARVRVVSAPRAKLTSTRQWATGWMEDRNV